MSALKEETGFRARSVDIETLEERDAHLEEFWADLQDVVFDDSNPNEDMKLLDPWGGFPAGTSREDIWHWFDERYSKGIAYLLYGDGVDRTREISHLYYLNQKCFECESEWCAYNAYGICKFPMVSGRSPRLMNDDGCIDCVAKEG